MAFVAVGYSLIYGILRFVNFAHGEVLAVSSLVTLEVHRALGWSSLATAMILGAVAGGVTAMMLEILVYRPFRRAGVLTLVMASFSASMAMQALMRLVWGSRSRPMPIEDPAVELFGGRLLLHELLIPVLLVIAVCALEYGLHRTLWGLTVRGLATSFQRVSYTGVRVNRAVAGTFILAGALAGIAGTVVALRGGASPSIGFRFALWAFAGTVVGGLGSIRGTLVGGFLVGIVLSIWSRFASVLYLDGAAFAAMALVLIWKPQGLFSRLDREV